jgi:hypothetical protein
MLNARIARLEREKRFRDWLTVELFLEGLTDQQLELYALHGQLPEPLPEPLPLGASRLDGMERNTDQDVGGTRARVWESYKGRAQLLLCPRALAGTIVRRTMPPGS